MYAATQIEYNTGTLKIRLQRFQNYGTTYWTARVTISNISQMKAALSYGTYGGTRQTTSNAVAQNRAVMESTEAHFPIHQVNRDLTLSC